MQRFEAPDDSYTIRRVVDNLFVDRSNVRAVVAAPAFGPFLCFACKTPIAVPTRCHRRFSAPPHQVGTFYRDRIGVEEVVGVLPR